MMVASTIVPCRDADVLRLQMQVHHIERRTAQVVLLEQVAEA